MAATFRGDQAQDQAKKLVQELRLRLKVTAYTYEKSFDFSKPEHGIGFNRDGTPITMRYQDAKVINEVAVLVGDFTTIDDLAGQKTLKRIKAYDPDCMKSEQAKKAQPQNAFQQLEQTIMPVSGTSKIGPLAQAFMAPNPLLPRRFFANHGVDKFVLDLNKDVPNSLLDCPGKYTVCIATFRGTVLMDQKKIAEVENGKNLPDQLVQAAEKAHKLTTWLRSNPYGNQLWQAYEFHDRDKSIVCVGSFDSLGNPRPDGTLEIDPQIQRIITTFGLDQTASITGAQSRAKVVDVNYPSGTPAAQRKSPDLVLFDIVPKPMEVPRRSISADYQHTLRKDL